MSFSQVFLLANDFYDSFIVQSSMALGTVQYPDSFTSSEKGMKVTFRYVFLWLLVLYVLTLLSPRNVSFRYPSRQRQAVNNVSFNVMPGQMVLVVGVNGSGKSTLMKLMARLFDPTHGNIYVDDQPLPSFDTSQLRDSMTFLSQSSTIYPVSLRENIQLGLPRSRYVEESDIEDAAHLGGSYDLIQTLPQRFDTVLDPPSMTLPSVGGCPGGASANLEIMMKQIIPERSSISGKCPCSSVEVSYG